MKILSLAILALLAACTAPIHQAEKKLNPPAIGIGVVEIGMTSNDDTIPMKVYKDYEATQKIAEFRRELWDDKADSLGNVILEVNPDVHAFCFRCLDSGAMYAVVINDSLGTTGWIKKQKNVSFITWQDYLVGFSFVTTDDKLRSSPNEKSPFINDL